MVSLEKRKKLSYDRISLMNMKFPTFLSFSIYLTIPTLAFAKPVVDFTKDVRPLLSEYCFHCHGPDKSTREAKLRLDTEAGSLTDLGGYSAIVPGKPEESELVFRLHSDDKDELMPPPKTGKTLTPEQKKIIETWIASGAKYEEHWSFRPIAKPALPAKRSSGHAIDRFLEDSLSKEKLSLSPQTDKITLLRRLYFDLTGMSPNPAEADLFLEDSSPQAYENLVDRLLGDERFGERMAVHWLDLVRFADTIGYHSDNFMEVSAYREYVIDSFNENLPYDQFVIENIAGDLLPEASNRQTVASGYNRLLQTTQEGGAQPDEYVTIYQADRVRNFGNVWLAATTGCAQCHDHKYDPFTIKDFYSLAAFFADIKEKAVGKRTPNLTLPTPEEEARLKELEDKLVQVEKAQKQRKTDTDRQKKALLAQLHGLVDKVAYTEPKADSSTDSERIFVEDAPPSDATLNGEWKIAQAPDPVFSGKKSIVREGAGNNQHFFWQSKSPYEIDSDEDEFFAYVFLDPIDPPKQVMLQFNDGTWEHRAYWGKSLIPYGKENTVGKVKMGELPKTGEWIRLAVNAKKVGLKPKAKVNGIAFTQFDGKIFWDKVGVKSTRDPRSDPTLSLAKWTDTAKSDKNLPGDVAKAAKKAAKERSEKESQLLRRHFLAYVFPSVPEEIKKFRGDAKKLEQESAKSTQELKKARDAVANAKKGLRTMLVSQAGAPRMVKILPRGNWLDKSGEEVQPAIPEFMGKLNTGDKRATRLDLAKWVVAKDNPLTARAFVNRTWKLFFGYGLSRRLDDLGGQGEPPTHPEILDHLATGFRDGKWDVKALVRNIVTSQAYRQSSLPRGTLATDDPGNRHYARQSRFRVDAEFVRDSALSISGLLVQKIGGKSVKPYQPAGYWQHLNFPARKWQAGQGDELYRRSLYTFVCRSFPHPAMVAFDAPSREECAAERPRSNIPQQALVLLNDPVFVEAAKALAERLLKEGEATDAQRLEKIFSLTLTRKPTKQEQTILLELLAQQRKRYQDDEKSALELLSTGVKPIDQSLKPAELAAWTSISRAMLNLYETTARF